MNEMPGEVCLIKICTRNGGKTVKGLLLARKGDTRLWLLVFFKRPDGDGDEVRTLQITSFVRPIREIGYSEICSGNVVETSDLAVIRNMGFVSQSQLSDVYCDIFATGQCYRLERYFHETPTGISFWINLNPPVGMRIPGMRRCSREGDAL